LLPTHPCSPASLKLTLLSGQNSELAIRVDKEDYQ
jgi:hypothetical protein